MALDESMGICTDTLYRDHLDCLAFPEDTFRELTLIATRGGESVYFRGTHSEASQYINPLATTRLLITTKQGCAEVGGAGMLNFPFYRSNW